MQMELGSLLHAEYYRLLYILIIVLVNLPLHFRTQLFSKVEIQRMNHAWHKD